MFKASIDGAAAVMVHPGDVVDVDRFMAGMLMQSQKAEPTDEKLHLNKEWSAPAVMASVASDPFSAFARAIESLTVKIGQLQKGH
jgi:hypothetical protein